MRKFTGLFIMITLAFAGFIGINSFFAEGYREQESFSKLKTKLQKTLVLLEDSNTPYDNSQQKIHIKKVSKKIAKKTQSSKSYKVINKSVKISKNQMLSLMNKTFQSLLGVRHIFRHEVAEMIEIIKSSKTTLPLSRKMIYAQNWSEYIKNNALNFNMNDKSKSLVKKMAQKMSLYIARKPIIVPVKQLVKSSSVGIKAPKAIDISSLNSNNSNKGILDRLMKKSIIESVAAIKEFEGLKKKASYQIEWMSYAWIAACCVFALVGFWMSQGKQAIKEKVLSVEEDKTASLSDIHNLPVDHEIIFSQEQVILNRDNNESREDMTQEGEDLYIFDEISNNLSHICQAKGVRFLTEEIENYEDIVKKFSLHHLEKEVEDFIKTVILSFGRDGEKDIKIHLKDADKKIKIIATVSAEGSLDVNMNKIASGFRNLEEKLVARKGVFNIEQSVLGNEIDFVMQLSAEQVKREDENVEKITEETTITQTTSITV